METYRLSGEGYTDEEMRVLKHLCKDTLADIREFERKKEREKKEKGRNAKKMLNKGPLLICTLSGLHSVECQRIDMAKCTILTFDRKR